MTIRRTIVLALSTTIGVLALGDPATASSPTFVDDSPYTYTVVADLDGDADVDGRDFLIWRRSPS